MTLLGGVRLEKSQDVLGHVSDHSGRKFGVGAQLRKLFRLDQLVLETEIEILLR